MNAIVSTVVPRPAFGKKKKKMSEAPNSTQCQKIRLKIMNYKQYLLTIKSTILIGISAGVFCLVVI